MSIEPAILAFADELRGAVIQPGDDTYDDARALYNGMIDRRPRVIARPVDVADVKLAVRFGQDSGLRVAIRGGGHNGAGLGSCDDGLVIDLSCMTGIRVDPRSGRVRVEAGCTQGDMDHATHAFGLSVPAGIVSTTGVAGLTLGGGHGYLSRRHGLTIDNLLEADVVLADGRFVTASKDQHPDLFWALRGGGGNFGVVTSFLFQAHPVHTVTAGPMFFDIRHARQILEWYRELLPTLPEEMYLVAGLKSVPPAEGFPEALHGRPVCGLIWCFQGPMAAARPWLDRAKELPEPVFEAIGEQPFPKVQAMFDPIMPPGMQWYWKGDFVRELTDAAIDAHVQHTSHLPSPLCLMHLYPIDGQVQRVAPDETAWAYRDVQWSMVIAGIDHDPANAAAISKWSQHYWEALHPHSAGGAYLNFMMDEGSDRVQATFQGNYERLARIKTRYDPYNFFQVNQNIPPAREGGA